VSVSREYAFEYGCTGIRCGTNMRADQYGTEAKSPVALQGKEARDPRHPARRARATRSTLTPPCSGEPPNRLENKLTEIR
jgi:hypothetical protein